MKKVLKIIVYFAGIALIVGVGIWSELNSGAYPHLQNKEGKVSVKRLVEKSRN